MDGRTITRADLTDAVYRAVGLSRNDSAEFVETVLEEIAASLEQGQTVKLSCRACWDPSVENVSYPLH